MVDSPASTPSNAPEWSVSDLSGALKRTVEDAFGFVRVRGEISGFRGAVASGHCYFALKDQNAKIDAVIWKGVVARLKTKPQEGLEVIATGKITTFPGKSSYQIIIDSLEPAGIGALMALLEARRVKLAGEGLFDEARKQLIPYLPRVIGVVTSPTGAVIRDVLHRLADRFPRHVIVWPVRVQGETSGAEVAAAIRGFNALPANGPIHRPDVIIVARGGGSLEDLMSFNEEAVVRAAAESDIPLVSAVGHETDWTLIDHAADLRAPTPTGAAEKVVPVRADLLAATADLDRRQSGAIRRLLDRRRSDFRAAARALPAREVLFATSRQRLDLAATRLAPALARNARAHEGRLSHLATRLLRQSPAARLAAMSARLSGLDARLKAANAALRRAEIQKNARQRDRLDDLQARARRGFSESLQRRAARLSASYALMRSLGSDAVLARGYALVRDTSGVLVRSPAQAPPGTGLSIRFATGTVAATVDGEKASQVARPVKKVTAAGGGQGSLF
jgi:exodeoxyribonuclease VII large subunit